MSQERQENTIEILANNLEKYIKNEQLSAKCTYCSDNYEVWEISKEVLQKMTDTSDLQFEETAGENSWWRYSTGSNLGYPYFEFKINGKPMKGWNPFSDYEIKDYNSVLDYILYQLGASQPRNVCSILKDIAKYNNMTMAEVLKNYIG